MSRASVSFHDLRPTADDLAADVLAGLSRTHKSIPPKYFYDTEGSRLFDAITELPEYYPTRTETAMLRAYADEIAARAGTGHLLVEPGSGSCTKARILFEGLQPCAYVPMDIARDHLRMAAQQVAGEFPWLEVHAACTDFTRLMTLPPDSPEGRRLAFFPGSSIGNFDPEDAVDFLGMIADMVGPGGQLLIGVDLKKDRAVLEAAYDDAQGVTAAFNLNLLARINRELGADFDLCRWRHKALYNEAEGRIEMHLVSRVAQQVTVRGHSFHFAGGETIHTENSYKYSVAEFRALAARAGFTTDTVWVDADRLFSLHLLQTGGADAD
ncbi:MAG: L-histidine N(alpha)-methyltransferase [Chromatiaceae bacterium]|nr:L-histidine N(alpha)-methyltransferase [Chromatiaceae bacterium]